MKSYALLLLGFASASLGQRTTITDPGTVSRSTESGTGTITRTTGGESSTTSIATASPSVTGQITAPVPSGASLPPKQAWCPSDIFCAGRILQAINLAMPYADSKTIVDKPTNGTTNETIQAFDFILSNNVTYGEMTAFLEQQFKGEGLELEPTTIPNFPQSPAALSDIPDRYIKGFILAVHKIWNLLIRDTEESTLCTNGKCESSLIPLNHTFVVPGGRFREQYYWDSKFILEGLLVSELNSAANSTLQNFMDEIERFGFIPNGGRIYYLNRSQPPVFITMIKTYVNSTGDTSILTRAFPIMEKELTWWEANRAVNITSPYSNQTHTLWHYAVINSAPRPESYLEDYTAANGDDLTTPYNDTEKAALYAELASGAESGWDYSSRWTKQPHAGNLTDQTPALRTLNVRNTIAVDLNAILYKARLDLASLYDSASSLSKRVLKRQSAERASHHREAAAALKAGILDLLWDGNRLGFYDFNLTSNARNTQLTAAHFYPLWAGVIPTEIQESSEKAFGAFSSLNLVLKKFNGTYPATFTETGLQWDFPNSWPPHIYFALEALANVPFNVSSAPLPSSNNSWNLLPENHLGFPESVLPLQTTDGNNTAPAGVDLNALNGTVTNGGNATEGEGWVKTLERELVNRYITSVFCSWYATGGSIPDLLPRLPDSLLNLTQSTDQDGHLFEKFSALDVDSAGRGGEYDVQAGFGWTNGVALWAASKYKAVLVKPTCPAIVADDTQTQSDASDAMVLKVGWVSVLIGAVALVVLTL